MITRLRTTGLRTTARLRTTTTVGSTIDVASAAADVAGAPWAAIGPAAYVGEIATTIPTSSAVANKIDCVDFIRALSFKNSRKAYASHAVGAMNGLWP